MTPRPTKATPSRDVGIWIRVSTDDQAQGDSPAHHEQRAREYAKFNGWTVREVYDLSGVSGKTVMEHPECKRMLADIRRGHISALIFSKLARLARNTRELLDFSDLFRKAGADMVSLQEKIDTSTPAGRLFYTMIAAMAQWEREEIGDRVRASLGVRARAGKPLNGSAPYGYCWKEKKLTKHADEAVVVKRLFEAFVRLRRKGAVARELNQAGYRTRQGVLWSDTAVARVLFQPAAKGTYFYNVTRKVGDWKYEEKPREEWSQLAVEPIITEELWHAVVQILESQDKKIAKPGKRPTRLFGGLTFCQCGHRMYVPSGSRKYTCVECKTKILDTDLEQIFHAELKAYFALPERLAEHFERARQSLSEKEQRVLAHRKSVQDVRDEMARTHRLYLDGHIPLERFGDYHRPLEERLRQLQEELPKLEAEFAHLSVRDVSSDEVLREARALYDRWPKLDLEEKHRVVQSLVEKIVIGKDELEITYSYLPSSEEMTISQQHL